MSTAQRRSRLPYDAAGCNRRRVRSFTSVNREYRPPPRYREQIELDDPPRCRRCPPDHDVDMTNGVSTIGHPLRGAKRLALSPATRSSARSSTSQSGKPIDCRPSHGTVDRSSHVRPLLHHCALASLRGRMTEYQQNNNRLFIPSKPLWTGHDTNGTIVRNRCLASWNRSPETAMESDHSPPHRARDCYWENRWLLPDTSQ